MTTTTVRHIRPAALPGVVDTLAGARRALLGARELSHPGERYSAAHLAALRGTAAVLAARAQPVTSGRGSKPVNAWVLLPKLAPELGEWALFFAMTARKRSAAEAGLPVTEREADDLVRDVECYLALVATMLGVAHQDALPLASA